ncbi:hypothetical protein AAG906_015533 [Vitis piasezkii]
MMDRGLLTDEALCGEASRYVDLCYIPMGGRDLSSPSPSSFGRVTLNEGSIGVSVSEVNEEEQTPLSIILADGSNGVLASKGEKPVAGEGSGWLPVGRQLPGESWRGKILRLGSCECKRVARRVVVLWDKRVLELVGLEVGIFSISCRFKNCEDGFMWFFTGVYGPTMKRYREPFWEELGAIRGLWYVPWYIGGDFNVIRFPSERSREGRLSSSMRRFSEVLDELALRDLPLQGMSQCTLPRPVSDHYPILLDGGGNMWLKEEGFKELLKGWWQGFNFSGSYSFVLSEKLKALKVKLKNWNKEAFGKVGLNLRIALGKVSFWDDQERQRVLNE